MEQEGAMLECSKLGQWLHIMMYVYMDIVFYFLYHHILIYSLNLNDLTVGMMTQQNSHELPCIAWLLRLWH